MANKQDLIAKVAEATELTKKDSAAAVDAVFASIEEFLAAGEKVQLIGFGNFEVRERAARQGEPDRFADRDPRRNGAGTAPRVPLHGFSPFR